MDANRTVLKGTIPGRFMEQRVANMLLGQFMRMAVDGSLGDVFEQVTETGALLKRRAGGDPKDKLPPFIGSEIVN